MTLRRFRRDVSVGVEYTDETPFGSPVGRGRRVEQAVRDAYAPLLEMARETDSVEFTRRAPELLQAVVRSEGFRRLAEPDSAGAWRIRPEVLFPHPAQAKPGTLALACEGSGRVLRVTIPPACWPLLHDMLAAMAGPGADPRALSKHAETRALLEAAERDGMLETVAQPSEPDPRLTAADITFVGHNTVVVRSESARVMVDPFLFARSRAYPARYQPLQARDVGPPDAILITHSHPDHFDPASLLQFPSGTPIIVPRVAQETILAVDMAERLRELGFQDIRVLDWGHSAVIADIHVHALPFYGEQATDGEVLHPTVRNLGNTYLVSTPRFSAAFLADSGRDGQGDVKQVASRARADFGPVTVVFSGYRGWLTYPAHLLFSPMSRFLLFVPPWLWTVRQQLMTTADEAVDVAERWGARFLVPYGDGGAPWHWRLGLGPDLGKAIKDIPWLDPFPERAVRAARHRTDLPDGSVIGSSVEPVLLRPGDSLSDVANVPKRLRLADHVWPYRTRRVHIER